MKNILLFGAVLALAMSCNIDEELRGTLTQEEAAAAVSAADLLNGAYSGLRSPLQGQGLWFAAQEVTSDECIAPTRGGDWDDGGKWRALHDHSWTSDHTELAPAFSQLLQVVFNTTNLLEFNPSASEAAQSRFLRAYAMLLVLDGWGQVPFRVDPTALLDDAEVLDAEETVNFVVAEINEILQNLPDGPANIANKDAARVLLMKTYLNKGAYLNRTSPSFDPADMTQVITLADNIINSGKYDTDVYFENMAPNNDAVGTGLIWTANNQGGVSGGDIRSRWFCGLHYNYVPSGWNGFSTLSDFYDMFEDSDVRKGGTDYPNHTEISGLKVGFLIGQQFDQNGTALEDRNGAPLSFTREVALIESGTNLEVTGIRVMKFPVDYPNVASDFADNDYPYYRFADVLLMKAEAMLRSNNTAEALTIVNDLRSQRGASTLSELTLDELIDERGREFYWEGFRRTDLIRFGKFLDAWQEKPATGDERLLFPIPTQSLAGNPNLVQNPGY